MRNSDGKTTVETESARSASPKAQISEARFKVICKWIAGGIAAGCTALVVAAGGTSGAIVIGMVDLILIATMAVE